MRVTPVRARGAPERMRASEATVTAILPPSLHHRPPVFWLFIRSDPHPSDSEIDEDEMFDEAMVSSRHSNEEENDYEARLERHYQAYSRKLRRRRRRHRHERRKRAKEMLRCQSVWSHVRLEELSLGELRDAVRRHRLACSSPVAPPNTAQDTLQESSDSSSFFPKGSGDINQLTRAHLEQIIDRWRHAPERARRKDEVLARRNAEKFLREARSVYAFGTNSEGQLGQFEDEIRRHQVLYEDLSVILEASRVDRAESETSFPRQSK